MKIKRLAVIMLSIIALLCVQVGVLGCNCNCSSPNGDSIFKDQTATTFTLTEDYSLSDADVTATGGSDKTVKFTKAVSFDLGGKTLDFNGYKLAIASDVADCLVTFKNGTLKNGALDVSVPNGDIDFDGAELADDLTYELEAASSTITISNAKIRGNGTIKSETNVKINSSEMGSVTLSGSAKLEAVGASKLGKLNIGKNASGASVVISNMVKVNAVSISAKSKVDIAGEVASVTVSEGATDAKDIELKVSPSAKIEAVEIKAPAKVDVSGAVKNVTVAETAKTEDASVQFSVSSSATVNQIDLQAKTELNVSGSVGNMVVGEKAEGTSVVVSGEKAVVGRVVVNAEATVEASGDAVKSVVVSKDVEEKVQVSDQIKDKVEVKEDVTDLIKPHTYELTERVAPTCETEGKEIYTCSDCGDSYELTLNKLAHVYASEITKHPSQFSAGERTYTCKECGHVYTEFIEALELKSKSIMVILGALIGDGSYSINIDENSAIDYFNEVTGNSDVLVDSRIFIKIQIANASLTVKDGVPYGSVVIKLSGAKVEAENASGSAEDIVLGDQEEIAEFKIYLDGEYFYYNVNYITDANGVVDANYVADFFINRFLSTSNGVVIRPGIGPIYRPVFGGNVYLTTDDIFELIEAYKDAQVIINNYKPFAEKVGQAINGIEIPVSIEEVIAYLGDLVISESFDEETSQTTYTLSVSELQEIVLKFNELTVAKIIDNASGEGTFANLKEKVVELPDMTVEEVVNVAIAVAEEYDLDVYYTFDVIEKILKDFADIEVDIKEMLEENYQKTLVEIAYENTNFAQGKPEKDDFIADIKQRINLKIADFETLTLDNWYNILVYRDIDYKPIDPETEEEAENVFAFSAYANEMLTMIGQMAEECGVIVDGEGQLVALSVNAMDMVIVNYSFIDGTYSFAGMVMGYAVMGEYIPEDAQIDLTVMFGEMVYSVSATYTEEGVNGTVYAITYDQDQNEEKVEIGSIEVVLGEDGMPASINVNLEGMANISYSFVDDVYTLNGTVMGYGAEIVYTPADGRLTANVTVGEQVYTATIIVDEFTFDAVLQVADRVLADILLEVTEDIDLNKLINGEISVMGYDLDVVLDEKEGTASLIFSMQGTTMIVADLVTDTETGEITMTVFDGAENQLGTITFGGTSITDFATEMEVTVQGTTLFASVAVETLTEGDYDYKFTYVIAPMIDGEQQKIEYVALIAFDATEEKAELGLDVTLDYIIDGEQQATMIDGTIFYELFFNELGEPNKLAIDVDVDRLGGPFGGNGTTSDGGYGEIGREDVSENGYLSIDLGVTVDLTSADVKDEEYFEDIYEKLEGISHLACDDGYYVMTYYQGEETEYYEITWEEDFWKGEQMVPMVDVYSVIVPAKNAIPVEGGLYVKDDCDGWVYFTYTHIATATVTTRVADEYRDILPDLGEEYQDREGKQLVNFSLSGYLNQDGEYSEKSHHEYLYDAKIKDGKDCSNGLTVKITCANCDYEETVKRDYCYMVDTEYYMHSDCGENRFTVSKCVACGDAEVYEYSACALQFEGREYLEKADFDDLGLNTTGFYEGYVERYTCYYCHATKDEYVYYTYDSTKNACTENVYYVVNYEGNEATPADSLDFFYQTPGHPFYHSDISYSEDYTEAENYAKNKEAILIFAKKMFNNSLPFTFESADLETYGCHVCDTFIRKTLYAYNDQVHLELSAWYENGEFVYADGEIYGTEFVCEKYQGLIEEYQQGSGEVEYASLDIHVNKDLKLSYRVDIDYVNGDELEIEVGVNDTRKVYFYDYSACGEGMNVVRSYYGANGELLDQEKSTRHDWEMVFSGVHCLEDGEYFEECASCGEIDEMDSEKRTHRSSTSWVYEINLIGLDEEYDEIVHMRGERCDYCYKIFNCKIELKSDWTLTENVYIYAEDIVFDFNGHTVDLNGYELVIYGFAGSDVRLYDSSREGIPEEELEANVIDTAGDGWLVVFSDNGYLNGGDNEILLGAGMSTASNVNYCVTDCENYLTIEDAIYEEYGAQLDTNFDFFAE